MKLSWPSNTPSVVRSDESSMLLDEFNRESRSGVKILLVEDHEIVRKGLYGLIEEYSSWKVCGEAGNGKEAIEKTLTLNPDLVVMDCSMPIMDGVEATKRIRQLCPTTKVVMVSMYDSQQSLAEQVGANAYVSKNRTWEDLRRAIASVLGSERS